MTDMQIETKVTRLLGINLPIIQAGMSWASSNSALPLAVSAAGGLGVIAAGPMYAHDLAAAIDAVRTGTDRPFAVNLPLYRKGADEIMDRITCSRKNRMTSTTSGERSTPPKFGRMRRIGR